MKYQVVAMLCATLLLTGCSGSSKQAETNQPPVNQPPTNPPARDLSGILRVTVINKQESLFSTFNGKKNSIAIAAGCVRCGNHIGGLKRQFDDGLSNFYISIRSDIYDNYNAYNLTGEQVGSILNAVNLNFDNYIFSLIEGREGLYSHLTPENVGSRAYNSIRQLSIENQVYKASEHNSLVRELFAAGITQ